MEPEPQICVFSLLHWVITFMAIEGQLRIELTVNDPRSLAVGSILVNSRKPSESYLHTSCLDYMDEVVEAGSLVGTLSVTCGDFVFVFMQGSNSIYKWLYTTRPLLCPYAQPLMLLELPASGLKTLSPSTPCCNESHKSSLFNPH